MLNEISKFLYGMAAWDCHPKEIHLPLEDWWRLYREIERIFSPATMPESSKHYLCIHGPRSIVRVYAV